MAFETDMELVFCVYLFEVIHKKDRLEPLSSVLNLRTEVENHTQTRLDPLSTLVKMTIVEGGITKVRKTTVYSLRGVMEICRYSPHPKTNALTIARYIPFEVNFLMTSSQSRITQQQMFFSII